MPLSNANLEEGGKCFHQAFKSFQIEDKILELWVGKQQGELGMNSSPLFSSLLHFSILEYARLPSRLCVLFHFYPLSR